MILLFHKAVSALVNIPAWLLDLLRADITTLFNFNLESYHIEGDEELETQNDPWLASCITSSL